MKKADYHMHTIYCDGSNAAEEMVLAAIDRGLTEVGISGHSHTAFDESYCMQKADIPRYIAELRYLRAKYFDKIHVLCGVEQDYYSAYPTDEFDYVIGSVHYVKAGEAYLPVDESAEILRDAVDRYFDGDAYALCERYFATVADVARKTGCDIIGHFDLITKFIERDPLFDTRHPRYVAAWQSAVDTLLPYDIPFEINTGAISRGYRSEPYPSREIIAYIREKGGRFILSSDAHSKENIGYGFEEYEKV